MKKKVCSNNCCYFSIHFVSSGATEALRCCVVQSSVKHNAIPFTVHCWSIGHCTFPYDIFVGVVIHSCYKIWINGRLMLKALQLVRSIAILAIWSHLVNCCTRVKLLQYNTMDFFVALQRWSNWSLSWDFNECIFNFHSFFVIILSLRKRFKYCYHNLSLSLDCCSMLEQFVRHYNLIESRLRIIV